MDELHARLMHTLLDAQYRIIELLEDIAIKLTPKKKEPASPALDEASAGSMVWKAYAESFEARHKCAPVRNARTNSLCKQLVNRLGVEAIDVARYYPLHPDAFYFRTRHDLSILVRDAEKIRTDWHTRRTVSKVDASGQERTAHAKSQLERIQKGEL